jgi:hypothetical protein
VQLIHIHPKPAKEFLFRFGHLTKKLFETRLAGLYRKVECCLFLLELKN